MFVLFYFLMIGYSSHYCDQLSHGANLVLGDINISFFLSFVSPSPTYTLNSQKSKQALKTLKLLRKKRRRLVRNPRNQEIDLQKHHRPL